MTDWVVVARVVRPQGRKGEVLCELLTDFPERFAAGATVYLAPPSFSGTGSDLTPRQITSSWLPHGKNEGRVVLGFAGVSSIDDAEKIAGLEALVPRSERHDLADGAVYVSDLIGCNLFDKGTTVGQVRDVNFATTPDGRRTLEDAAPLLAVTDNSGEEHLVPFAKAWIVRVDVEGRRIEMDLPDGLLDATESD